MKQYILLFLYFLGQMISAQSIPSFYIGPHNTQNQPIIGNVGTLPTLPTDQSAYVAIYKRGDLPQPGLQPQLGGPVSSNSEFNFKSGLSDKGIYFATLMGMKIGLGLTYNEIAPRIDFYVGPQASLTTNKASYSVGQIVNITFSNGPNTDKDWIGIYKAGTSAQVSTFDLGRQYVSGTSGTSEFANLPKGYYYAQYYVQDQDVVSGLPIHFKVGNLVTEVSTDRITYSTTDNNIYVYWKDSPALYFTANMETYKKGDVPGISTPVAVTSLGLGALNSAGMITMSVSPSSLGLGDYFVVMTPPDSAPFEEYSNRAEFSIVSTTPTVSTLKPVYSLGEMMTVEYEHISGSSGDGIGIYRVGEIPGPGTPPKVWKDLSEGPIIKGFFRFSLQRLETITQPT